MLMSSSCGQSIKWKVFQQPAVGSGFPLSTARFNYTFQQFCYYYLRVMMYLILAFCIYRKFSPYLSSFVIQCAFFTCEKRPYQTGTGIADWIDSWLVEISEAVGITVGGSKTLRDIPSVGVHSSRRHGIVLDGYERKFCFQDKCKIRNKMFRIQFKESPLTNWVWQVTPGIRYTLLHECPLSFPLLQCYSSFGVRRTSF